MVNEFLDSLTSPQRDTMDRLRRALRGSHFTDIKVRTGGKDLYFEGDWMGKALDHLSGPAPNWKHAFLFLSDLIDKTRMRHLSDPGNSSVERLLDYHMRRTIELLFAVVNGGLEECYDHEAEQVLDEQRR